MGHPNRVTPWGAIEAHDARGDLTGNRGGRLHDAAGRLVRAHVSRSWITCLLEFRGRRKPVMAPGVYSSLFFLDEAVSMAAGHRPCAECRRPAAKALLSAWHLRHPDHSLADLDRVLHPERRDGRWPQIRKVTYETALGDLPSGVYVERRGGAWLVHEGHLRSWAPAGYRERVARRGREQVTVLTPRSLVQAIADGYTPSVHASAH